MRGLGPGFADLCLRTARLHGSTDAQAMIDDYLVCRRTWGLDPAVVRAVVNLWHGRADRLRAAGHVLELASAIPGCIARVDPTGGHFFYSRRLADILEPLASGATRV